MASTASGAGEPARSARRGPRRDLEHRLIAGVCSGLARQAGIDPLVVRIVFVAMATAGGVGIPLYLIAWLLMPAGEADAPPRRRIGDRRAELEVAIGAGLLLLSVLLGLRALGIWFTDAIVWPAVLLVSGGALLWRQSLRPSRPPDVKPPTHPAPAVASAPAAEPGPAHDERAALVSRTGRRRDR